MWYDIKDAVSMKTATISLVSILCMRRINLFIAPKKTLFKVEKDRGKVYRRPSRTSPDTDLVLVPTTRAWRESKNIFGIRFCRKTDGVCSQNEGNFKWMRLSRLANW